MKHSLKTGAAVLVVAFVPACGGIPDADMVDGSLEADSLGTAESALSECLAIDLQKNYSAKLLGGKGDDSYPMNGKTIKRVELNHSVKATGPFGLGGRGNANVDKQDSTEVVVHFWYDAYTDLSYSLKVWVEC
jgi:hypothetical protein